MNSKLSMSTTDGSSGSSYVGHADITDTSPRVARTDPNRLALLSEYLSLQLSEPLKSAAAKEDSAVRAADRLAARLNLSRDLGLAETPSEKRLVDKALEKCSKRVAAGMDTLRSAEDLQRQQRVVLAMIYPTHRTLQPTLDELNEIRKRISILRRAIRDQTQALAKLMDAANLLLLISDHVDVLNTCYAGSCTSSSSDWSSEGDDGVKVGCLGRSDESRFIYITSVPSNYRIRYLRKCWGFAADALSAAVDLSSYLAKQLEREGSVELIPGIDVQTRPSTSLFELPGGMTLFFRSDMLQRMSNDAKTMRECVLQWQLRQRKFVARIRRDLAKSRRKATLTENKLAELRQKLLSEEFSDSYPLPS